jgi:2-amino-4-hydroxy-6-hydroxymethyldihydropteridine diphosphokinase
VTDQPPFVNLALVVETMLEPRALLDRALRIEAEFGRDRSREQRWGSRTLDIDIIACGALEIDEPGLTLPHPHLFERAFVLAPLAEIAPDRTVKGIRIADALARLGPGGVEKLPPRKP